MKRILGFTVIAVLALTLMGAAQARETILIKNATIVPVTGPAIPAGSLLIREGKIAAIGTAVEAPAGARIIDASGKFVYPGLVAVMTAVGVTGYPGAGNDIDEVGTSTPHMDPHDAINPEDDCIEVTRIGGVTTVQTISGSRSVINGTSVILDLAGTLADELVVERNVAQIFNMGAKTPGKYPSTIPGVVAFLKEKLTKARDYVEKKTAAKPATPPAKRDLEMEALAGVITGKVPVILLTYDEVTLRNALNLIEEFKLKGIISARQGILKYAGRLAEAGIPVIWAGTTGIPARWQPYDLNYHTAAVLAEKGVLFTFDPGGWGPGNRNVRNLPVPASISIAHGLSEQAALEALTINPAKILGIDGRVGSLEVGKDANLAIWSGSPLQLRSRIHQVIIQGRMVPMTSLQTLLRDRFDKIVKERMKK